MTQGENEAEIRGRFRWKTGIAIILSLAVAAYFIKLISPQPEDDHKKSEKFADSVVAVAAVAATQGDFPVYLSRFGNRDCAAHGHGKITR